MSKPSSTEPFPFQSIIPTLDTGRERNQWFIFQDQGEKKPILLNFTDRNCFENFTCVDHISVKNYDKRYIFYYRYSPNRKKNREEVHTRWLNLLMHPEGPFKDILPHLLVTDQEYVNRTGFIFPDLCGVPGRLMVSFILCSRIPGDIMWLTPPEEILKMMDWCKERNLTPAETILLMQGWGIYECLYKREHKSLYFCGNASFCNYISDFLGRFLSGVYDKGKSLSLREGTKNFMNTFTSTQLIWSQGCARQDYIIEATWDDVLVTMRKTEEEQRKKGGY